MLTVHKYPLAFEEKQTISIPNVFQVLTVQLQDDKPVLWAIVNDKEPVKDLEVLTICTGDEMPYNAFRLGYITTLQRKGTYCTTS